MVLVEFVFADLMHFIGTIVLLSMFFYGIEGIIKAFRK